MTGVRAAGVGIFVVALVVESTLGSTAAWLVVGVGLIVWGMLTYRCR